MKDVKQINNFFTTILDLFEKDISSSKQFQKKRCDNE